MSGSVIKSCAFAHKFQDAEHGEGKRVHNYTRDKKYACCTVCGDRKGK